MKLVIIGAFLYYYVLTVMWKTTLQNIRKFNGVLSRSNYLQLSPHRPNLSTLLTGRKVIARKIYAILSNNFVCFNSEQLKQFELEYKAAVGLISRSLGITPQAVRQFHLSLYSKPSSSEKDGASKPTEAAGGSGSAGSSGSGPNSNGNKNDNDDKIKSVLTKTIMWMFTIYMFVAFISLILSPRSDRPEVCTYNCATRPRFLYGDYDWQYIFLCRAQHGMFRGMNLCTTCWPRVKLRNLLFVPIWRW